MLATQLRGRELELEALIQGLEAARAGSGTTIMLEGEAGIGKTRLLDELSARADLLEFDVRRGVGEELEQERPFGPLLEALGAPDTVPTLRRGASPGAADARFLAQDAFVDHVDRLAAARPMLLALDDLHWADRATLATVWALARRVADSGLVLVLAFRPSPTSPDLRRVLQGCADLGALHLRIGPISDDALVALATDVLGAPVGPALLERLRGAHGNPFVAIEVLRALDAEDGLTDVDAARDLTSGDLPEGLRSTLLRYLSALSDEAQRALSVAAVLGGTGRVEDIAALLEESVGRVGEAVAEATRARLLDPTGELVSFRHDLIREALYESLSAPVRASYHRLAAERLKGRVAPAVVANHLALGATPGDADAAEGLRDAACELARDEPDAAAGLLDRALELTRDPAMRARLAVARAEALLSADRATEAAEEADRALSIAAAPKEVTARAYLALGHARAFQGLPAFGVEAFAAARATDALDDRTAADALSHQAENRAWTFALDQARDEAERALEEGRRLGVTDVVVGALAVRSAVLAFGADVDAAVESGREAVALAGDNPEAIRRTPHAYLGLALVAADRLEEARRVSEEGRRRATELGQMLVVSRYQGLLARIAWFAGRWDDALAEVETGRGLVEDFGARFGDAANQGVRGLVAFHRGDYAEARAVLERGVAVRGQTGDASGSELVVLLQAQLMELDRDPKGAAETLLGLFELERALGMDAARVWPGPACVRLALAAGDVPAAREVAADLEQVAGRAGTASARGAAAFARGAVEHDADRLGEAAGLFAQSGRPLDKLVALEATGLVHAETDRRDEAVACLREASTIAEKLGAAHDARRLGSALRRLGVRPKTRPRPKRPVHGWEALTDAERDVARLVEAGLGNAEIAEHLFISRRTVETHVSRLYQKLGADNRVALGRVIRDASEAARA